MRFVMGRIGARAPYFLHYSTIISATTILFGLSMFLSMNSDWATSASMVFNRTRRPAYHPATLLKIYVYGYLNRVQSKKQILPKPPRGGLRVHIGIRSCQDSRIDAPGRRRSNSLQIPGF